MAGPQTIGCETSDLTKGVKTAAMRIAGQIVKLFELSENSNVDARAESSFQIRRVAILSWSSSFRKESGEKARGLIML